MKLINILLIIMINNLLQITLTNQQLNYETNN